MQMIKLKIVCKGRGGGKVLKSPKPISFLGDINPSTGVISDPENPCYGMSVKGRVLIFPHGRGSTVGSYVLYRMKVEGTAPSALVSISSEPIVVVGAIMAGIPYLEGLNKDVFFKIPQNTYAIVNADEGWMKYEDTYYSDVDDNIIRMCREREQDR